MRPSGYNVHGLRGIQEPGRHTKRTKTLVISHYKMVVFSGATPDLW